MLHVPRTARDLPLRLASGTKTLVFGEKGLWEVADQLGTGAGSAFSS